MLIRYQNMKTKLNVFFLTLQENGVTGLFKGIVPRCVRRTLMAALAWTVFEEVTVALYLSFPVCLSMQWVPWQNVILYKRIGKYTFFREILNYFKKLSK